ncbi:MAG: hypothetical protein M3N28_08735 [Actinomycetota bacterium]|nr:hypothetical protein [Actinomycetota bacterium]
MILRPLIDVPSTPATDDDTAVGAILRGAAFLAVAAVVVQSAAHLVDVVAFDLSVNLINVDSDTSAFTWASVVTEGTAAAMGLLMAATVAGPRGRLLLLSGLLAFFSLDDAVEIHERISSQASRFLDFPHSSRVFWPLVFLPLLSATFVLLWNLARHAHFPAGRAIRFGLVLLAAAVALEVASPLLISSWDHGDLAYELEVVIEEGLELGGWIMITGGLAAILVGRRATVPGRPPSGVSPA